MHPLRLQFELFSNANPFMAPVAAMADQVRENRKPAAADNSIIAFQENVSRQVVTALDAWRDVSEAVAERTFLSVYGSPTLQAAVGIDPESTKPLRKAGKSVVHKQLLQAKIAELKSRIGQGGLREAVIRAALYVGTTRGSADERGFETIRRIRAAKDDMPRLTLQEFKALVREQYFMMVIDKEAALAAIPSMLPPDAAARRRGLTVLRQVIGARGDVTGETAEAMERVTRLFNVEEAQAKASALSALQTSRTAARSKASYVRIRGET